VKQLETVTVVRIEEDNAVALVASFPATDEGKEHAEKLFVHLAKEFVDGFKEDETAEGICVGEGKASDGFNTIFLMNSSHTDEELDTILETVTA
jgi:hypothetical protein